MATSNQPATSSPRQPSDLSPLNKVHTENWKSTNTPLAESAFTVSITIDDNDEIPVALDLTTQVLSFDYVPGAGYSIEDEAPDEADYDEDDDDDEDAEGATDYGFVDDDEDDEDDDEEDGVEVVGHLTLTHVVSLGAMADRKVVEEASAVTVHIRHCGAHGRPLFTSTFLGRVAPWLTRLKASRKGEGPLTLPLVVEVVGASLVNTDSLLSVSQGN